MAAEASRAALTDCGLTPSDVDGFTCFTTGESANAPQVAHAIGIDDIGWSSTVRGGGNVVATVVAGAAAAIVTGQAGAAVARQRG